MSKENGKRASLRIKGDARPDGFARYDRQVRIFGQAGQVKLARSRVLLAGAGGLGSAAAFYLAASGVGVLRIVDSDTVERSNLNRQILFDEDMVGNGKAAAARDRLLRLNPEIEIQAFPVKIEAGNVFRLVEGMDVIVDALDNFQARYLLNRQAIASDIPLVHGAVQGYSGQATTIIPGKTPCLECIFPGMPKTDSVTGLGIICGIIGCVQAAEVMKCVLGRGDLLENRLLLFDTAAMRAEEIPLGIDPDCPECGSGKR